MRRCRENQSLVTHFWSCLTKRGSLRCTGPKALTLDSLYHTIHLTGQSVVPVAYTLLKDPSRKTSVFESFKKMVKCVALGKLRVK